MPSTSYTRRDHAIRIAAAGETAEISVTTPEGETVRTPLSRDLVDRAARGDDAALRAVMTTPLSAGWASPQWQPVIARVTIEVAERAWAAIAFESFLPAGGWLVRTSPVYSRVLQVPLAFPIRVLETGIPAVVSDAIEQTFHGTYREHALVDARSTINEVEALLKESGWQTVEILHLHDLVVGPSVLSTTCGGAPGTVGWLLRFADRFQTRLFIIEAVHTDLPPLRRAAQSIIDRGGPAVWLFERSSGDYRELYGDIAHDRPLDWIRPQAGGELFAGGGAEEALRYSTIGDAFCQPDIVGEVIYTVRRGMAAPAKAVSRPPQKEEVAAAIVDTVEELGIAVDGSTIHYTELWGTRAERFGDALSARLTRKGLAVRDLGIHLDAERNRGVDLTIENITHHVQTNSWPLARMNRETATEIFSTKLRRIGERMQTYEFESHESDGMLPLAGKVADARAVIDVLRGKRRRASRKPRHVNMSFSTIAPDGSLQRLAQASARLKSGEIVHFGVRIAPKDPRAVTLGSTVFLEEQVRWDGDGAWIEIGVTPIDFDLLGDPVQEVWLPKEEPTDLITFAVRPRVNTVVPGVARLRVAIYHRNNVLQSFLVAAVLESPGGDMAPALASALNATLSDVRRLGEVRVPGAAGIRHRAHWRRAVGIPARAHDYRERHRRRQGGDNQRRRSVHRQNRSNASRESEGGSGSARPRLT